MERKSENGQEGEDEGKGHKFVEQGFDRGHEKTGKVLGCKLNAVKKVELCRIDVKLKFRLIA